METRPAVSAPHIGQHYVISCRDFFHVAAYPFDNTRSFMPKHDRQRDIIELIARYHVGMTHASSHDTNQDLFRSWLIQSQILDPEGSTLLSNRRCPDFHHIRPPLFIYHKLSSLFRVEARQKFPPI